MEARVARDRRRQRGRFNSPLRAERLRSIDGGIAARGEKARTFLNDGKLCCSHKHFGYLMPMHEQIELTFHLCLTYLYPKHYELLSKICLL
jgi:hypothetical protein